MMWPNASLLSRGLGRFHRLRAFAASLLLCWFGCGGDAQKDATGALDAACPAECTDAGGESDGDGEGAAAFKASARIGPSGGAIAVGALRLNVPAGALAKETEITITRKGKVTPGIDDRYVLEPDGLEFDAPVGVILALGSEVASADADFASRRLAYVRPAPLGFEFLRSGAGNPTAGVLIGALRHFSTLAAPQVQDPVQQTYPVHGECSQLASQFAFGGYASETRTFCDFEVRIVDVTMKAKQICKTGRYVPRNAESTIHLPTWTDECPLCAEAWASFITQTLAHEQRHVNIGEAGCASLADTLGAADKTVCVATKRPNASQEVDNKLVNAFNDDVANGNLANDANQERFDNDSKHGGITLDCSCEEAFRTDEENCGECEHHCRASETCIEGVCKCEKTCPDGMHLDPVKCECNGCPGNGFCPEGSVLESDNSCRIDCAGGTVAGFPCTYSGTSSMSTGGAGGVKAQADLTLTAARFDGCLIVYEPSGTVTYVPPSGNTCSYDPISATITSGNTHGTFVIGMSPPTMIADLASLWPATITCNMTSVQGQAGWGFIFTTGKAIPSKTGALMGTYTDMTNSSEWNLTPQ